MFRQISSAAGDPNQLFQQVAKQLVDAGKLHQLFDLRLLEHRHKLGLAIDQRAALDDVPSPAREQLEQAYLDACREVGLLLLKSGQARDAWTYLRPTGDKAAVREWLAQAVPDEEHADELIELALYEAIDAERGFAWLLAQRGTCNAITEFDGLAARLSVPDQRACAAVLVRHLHDELLQSVRGHLQRLEREIPTGSSVVSLLTEYPDLLADGAYHVDTSHLATTVRFSRVLTDRKLLPLAIELATYGDKLAKELQYPDQPPFEETYRTHLLFFEAMLGEQVEAAVEYFRQQAETVSTEYYGSSAIEAYLILLIRTGQSEQALEEYHRLVPVGSGLSAHAPTPLQLAEQSGNWDRYLEICEQRDDAVGFVSGLLARNEPV
ncbi:MAG: hypothetical protein AAGD11_16550 [Planctomycetota bacterium]